MDFLRLHLPGLHQALRGALDSLSTFLSYLMGDEVPTAETRGAGAAEELREVAAGRSGRTMEEEAQEALGGLGSSQSKGEGGLRGAGEAGRHQEGSSTTEQTWGWGEGSSHGSQADRQDTGAWEAAKATRCQEPSAPLEARKKSKARSEAGRDESSQAQESQEPDEQEVTRGETLRTWEQEEEEEEVRAREPRVAEGAESVWTWHRESEEKAVADGQKVAGDGREMEPAVKKAVAEEIQGPGAKGAGREEEVVVVVRGSQSTRAQGTQEQGEESGGGAASGREEAQTTSGREEAETLPDGEEAGTTSGREEAWTTSGMQEAETLSGGEEAGATSGREETETTSGKEEAWTASGREEAWTTSGMEEAETLSGREEAWTTSGMEEAETLSGREEAWTTSGREDAETISGMEEAETLSGWEEAGTTSGREDADFLGVRETEYEAVLGKRIPEDTERFWALEEASEGDQEEEVDENREDEGSLFPKQTQGLGTEGVEEVAEDQTAERKAAEDQESEGEVGEGFEGQEDQGGKEAEGRQDSEIRATQASLEEVPPAEEAEEKRQSCWATEAELPQDKAANEAEGDANLEATPQARPEKELCGERSEEEAQMGQEASEVEWSGLKHEVTEGEEPELIGGPQTLREQPEEGQGCKEELWSIPALSKEETEGRLEEYPRHMGYVKPDTSEAEVWENRRRRDVERGHSQEEKADAEEGEEEAAGGQALEAEAKGGQESALPEVPEAGWEWKKAKEAGCGAEEGEAPGAESQELGGRHGAEAGTGQPLGESDARETKDEEVEAAVPWGADGTSRRGWRLEEAALSLQDSEDTWASSLAAEIVEEKAALGGRTARAGEGPEREAGETFGRGWDSGGRDEAGESEDLVETAEGENRGEQESGLEGSAEEEVTDRGSQAEDFEAKDGEPWGDQAEARESVVAEGSCGMDGFTSGSHEAGAEGTMAIVEAEGLPGGKMQLEKEAGGWQAREQGQGSEGQDGDHHPEGEVQRLLEVEDVKVTEDQRAGAEEIDPESLEDVQSQEDLSANQDPTEIEPGPGAEAAGSARGDAHSGWSEYSVPSSL
ncbi:apolipoprotein B receptor isoform X2 [Diceros bicornis minor]|uniref:apolipoprotein B receptor isoform X2 n=1 Tax=Diceros bicornis minor TaxID=77932 RepID=UPI0026EAE126|nr:apolipoprotein B receptor isoform X2 [Diceros bicornis minor]